MRGGGRCKALNRNMIRSVAGKGCRHMANDLLLRARRTHLFEQRSFMNGRIRCPSRAVR
jgi:hypothetical protein